MMNTRWIAAATLCLGMGFGVAGTPLLVAQQTDENGQVTNPQPHTKKEYKQEKKREKKELKHNQKSDKAAAKAAKHEDKATSEQEKSAREADKANQAAQQPQ
ncbi:MAG TPA: hypothetical protein VF018_05395 [Acidobacteriaceae bacterium]